ncbi:MAG: 3-oxoadipate enol-lactonase [Gammaproteobacteria bacterium]
MPLVDTRTIRINATDEGPRDAPAIVFSNSLGANLGMWQPQADAFAERYRVIRYDQRGHGQTEVPAGPYSFDELVADAVALMDALEIGRAHFVGLSMGGMTALGLALDHAERLLSMTACNCVAGYGPEGRAVWDERIAAVRTNGLDSLLDATIERWFTEPTRAARPDDMAAVRAMVSATPVAGYLGCCGALRELAYLDRLSAISVPSLFIAGTHDIGAPPAAMQDMHARVAGSQYVELDAAHVSNLERPEAFSEALAKFLTEV